MIQAMKAATFEQASYVDWQKIAVESLRGAPFDSLLTETFEGIEVKPLYTVQDLERTDQQMEATLSAIRAATTKPGWIVAQQQTATDAEVFIEELKNSLARGNEAIVYDGQQVLKWTSDTIAELAKLLPSYPLFFTDIQNDDGILQAFQLVPQESRAAVTGAVSLAGGALPEGFPNIRTVSADVRMAHHAGADIVTELALVIAEAAEVAIRYDSFDAFSERFFVRFSIDTQFFMEIAKIRAFRILWQALGTAFDEEAAAHVPVLCETSLRSYSKLDPYVNLLRAGNETFAAVLGGADVITVHPHDVLTGSTPASVRYARNIQLVIKEETFVNKVQDPSAGSYFLETMTNELVEKAWQLFLEIDQLGGYKAFVKDGSLDERLAKLQVKRMEDVAASVRSLIGTNVYADLETAPLTSAGDIELADRLAEPFEEMRMHFAQQQPHTVLLTFGKLKDFKVRADFVSGFLATGGIRALWSPELNDVNEAIQWLQAQNPDYAVVCATPEVTESVMEKLLAALPEGMVIDVAGQYEEPLAKQWLGAGLNGFIHNGQNKIAKLSELKKLVTRG